MVEGFADCRFETGGIEGLLQEHYAAEGGTPARGFAGIEADDENRRNSTAGCAEFLEGWKASQARHFRVQDEEISGMSEDVEALEDRKDLARLFRFVHDAAVCGKEERDRSSRGVLVLGEEHSYPMHANGYACPVPRAARGFEETLSAL